jgi:hypothetical protein
MLVACGVLVSMVGTLVGVALAHDKTYNRTISIQYNSKDKRFFGTIGSNNPECKDAQQVTLYENNVSVATTTSDGAGQYSFNFTAKPGATYYVRVEQNVTGGYGHSHVCQAAQSRTIRPVSGSSATTTNNTGGTTTSTSTGGDSIAIRLIGGLLKFFSSLF